jgi:exonuclease VII small subunit
MPKPKSRPQRWSDAATDAAQALTDMEEAKGKFEEAMAELKSVQDEYEEWKDNLPENLQQSPLGEKLEEVCGLDLETAAGDIDSAVSNARDLIEEAEALDLPRGFGKD